MRLSALPAPLSHQLDPKRQVSLLHAIKQTSLMNFVQRFTFLFSAPTFDAEDLEGLRYSVKHSIYFQPEHLHAGIGRVLLPALIDACAAAGYRQIIGYIDAANKPSIGLHTACGFREVGYLPSVAYKFGQWTDMVMVQRSLGSGGATAPGVWPVAPAESDGSEIPSPSK
jgi:GNAT superfamily N-acetyltransferase